MKFRKLLFLTLLFVAGVSAQNLHSDFNAASIDNEVDDTEGWSGNAAITSDASNPFSGAFALKATTTAENGRNMDYSFDAVIGATYNISIWAKEGPQSFEPAFANWAGLDGFSGPVLIEGTDWTEYTFQVVATDTNPTIRVFTSPLTGGAEGDMVLIDNVSILVQDDEAPNAVTDLAASNTTDSSTTLSWTEVTDDIGVVDYEVFQDGVSIGNTNGATSFTVTGLDPETTFEFNVIAIDANGNASGASNAASVTTTASDEISCGEGKVAICFRGRSYCVPKYLAWIYVKYYGASFGNCDTIEKPVIVRARVYPNPTKWDANLFVKATKRASVKLKIFNRYGRLVYQDAVTLEEGRNRIRLNTSSLRRGVYLLKIQDGGIDRQGIRILKY